MIKLKHRINELVEIVVYLCLIDKELGLSIEKIQKSKTIKEYVNKIMEAVNETTTLR